MNRGKEREMESVLVGILGDLTMGMCETRATHDWSVGWRAKINDALRYDKDAEVKTIVLWAEDDAPVPDKERIHEAVKRMFGQKALDLIMQIPRKDLGDAFVAEAMVEFYFSYPGATDIRLVAEQKVDPSAAGLSPPPKGEEYEDCKAWWNENFPDEEIHNDTIRAWQARAIKAEQEILDLRNSLESAEDQIALLVAKRDDVDEDGFVNISTLRELLGDPLLNPETAVFAIEDLKKADGR